MSVSTQQIGDGKLPNKYWVSISEDYHYESEPGVMDWASDHKVIKDPKGKTLKAFDSYSAAKRFAADILLGEPVDDIVANTVTIEDRLSGEVFWKGKEFSPQQGKMWEDEREDIDFSVEQEAKLMTGRKSAKPKSRTASRRKSRRSSDVGTSLGGMR